VNEGPSFESREKHTKATRSWRVEMLCQLGGQGEKGGEGAISFAGGDVPPTSTPPAVVFFRGAAARRQGSGSGWAGVKRG